jgi:flagellar motor protein MotB
MIAQRAWRLPILAVLAILLTVTLGGCESARLQEERDALTGQNTELQSNLNNTRAALEAAENDRNNLTSEVNRLQAELDAARKAGANIPRIAANTPPSKNGFSGIEGIETIQGVGKITLRIPGDVLFPSGKTDLKPTAQKTLDQIAAVIKKDYATKTIRVEGYTDTDPIKKSKWDDNLELSLHRAAEVVRYIDKKGVDAKHVYAAGFGEHRPRDSKEKSRRVEIVVVLNDL